MRTVEKDGEAWFVAKDVCDILGLGNITEALRSLEIDELSSKVLKSDGQNREMKLVSESGLYNLIFRSYKPEAKQFRRWVTHEVLPDIRNVPEKVHDRVGLRLIRVPTDFKQPPEAVNRCFLRSS